MQRIRVVSFTLLLIFILSFSTKLFSENDIQDTNADQTQQQGDQPKKEESFWASEGARIACATCGAALVLFVCIWVTHNSSIDISYKVDKAGNRTIIDSGQKYSVKEWAEKYKGTEKYKILFGDKE
jgi:hypothetical protein